MNRYVAYSICNLKYSIPNEITIIFHNESSYDYHFIIKELEEEFLGQFTCLDGNTEKYIIFLIPKEKVTRISKNGEEITDYNSLIAQDLWQIPHQIFLIILLKKFIKLNVNMDMIIKNVEHAGLNTKIASFALNIQTLKTI